ncbi:MAG TPA: ABC transporter ATP-binding protein [Bacillota bacterium]|jgi:biotin transport system ATP-binding protein|nr:ABC transporter ATP-binding protein [Bacillota bacterium]HOL09039.1 ABC transporter ATP-binding protein [Bacillota bacterium]HPO96714.1 ABC transporter ATP-binding protein [Bacillota bacterium]
MALLETINLTHTFTNGFTAIKDINLSIQKGDFIIIAGANGSGKTVLIRHFNGLLAPTKGEVLIEGTNINHDLLNARKTVGLIFQDSNNQIVGQTVAEDVAFGPENLGLPQSEITDRVTTALIAVQLLELSDQRPHTLSGGQKRKLAIAGVLAMLPKLLVFDEPFTGLDYPGVVQVLEQIISLHQNGHTIVVVTHELEKILAHANRLIIMQHGQIIHDDHPAKLINLVESFGIKRPYGENRGVESMTWLS